MRGFGYTRRIQDHLAPALILYTGNELCTQLSEEVLYNLRVNALWHHSILSDNVADNVAPEQSSAPVLLTTINQIHGHS